MVNKFFFQFLNLNKKLRMKHYVTKNFSCNLKIKKKFSLKMIMTFSVFLIKLTFFLG